MRLFVMFSQNDYWAQPLHKQTITITIQSYNYNLYNQNTKAMAVGAKGNTTKESP
jgi:hypothetical protein